MSKMRRLLLGIGSLAGAFSLAACSVERSPEEQAAHTAALTTVAQAAEARCAIATSDGTYHQRLHQVLDHQSTDTLQALAARDIAICLDPRLTTQQGSGRRIEMVFYGAARVVSIPDNGVAYDSEAWSQDNPAFHARSAMLNRLVSRLVSGEVRADATSYGTSRKPHKRSRRYYWKNINEMDADRLRQNPWLHSAPLRQSPSAAARPAQPSASW